MNKKNLEFRQPNSFALISEALSLVKAGGCDAALLYYLGSLPFTAALLYFWNDMVRHGFAEQRMVGESLLVTGTFAWMKVWQSLFCRRLHAVRTGLPPEPITLRSLGRSFGVQASLQPWGLLLIPLSLLLMAPFAVTHAFFQNCSVLDDGRTLKEVRGQAAEQARLWPLQNHLLIWILSPWLLGTVLVLCFGCAALLVSWSGDENFRQVLLQQGDLPWMLIGVLLLALGIWPAAPLALTVAANFAIVLWLGPQLLNSLFGWETAFARGSLYSIANSTTLLTIHALTYLVLDPVLKSAYVLRSFHGAAARTGADLLADLKKVALAGLLVGMAFAAQPGPAAAAESVGPVPRPEAVQELDQAIELTLQQEEYAYRLPRRLTLSTADNAFLHHVATFFRPVFLRIGDGLKWLATRLERLFTWLGKFFKPAREPARPAGWDFSRVAVPLATVLVITAAVGGLFFLYRKRRAKPSPLPGERLVDAPAPDLANEGLRADLLPEAEWLRLGEKMLADGNLRLALRAFFLAGLTMLAQNRLISLEISKSNRDYAQEIGRHGQHYPNLPALFGENTRVFEKSWYGDHPVADAELTRLITNLQQIRGYFGSQA